jgi:hypothetical protein
MARSRPEPDPRPTDGGSYLLDEATGKWINQDRKPAPVMTDPAPAAAMSDDPIDA